MRKPYTLTVDERGDVLVAGPDPKDPTLLFVAKLDMHGTVLWRRWLDQAEPRVTPVPDSERVSWEPDGEELRDSFEPLMLDGDRPTLVPTPRLSRWRRMGAMIAAACVLSASLAGGAMARGSHIGPAAGIAYAGLTPELTPSAAPLEQPRPTASHEVVPAPAWTATFDDLGLDEDATADELRGAALVLLQLGEPLQAQHVATRLVELAPADPYGYLLDGAALQELGRIADVRVAYQRCAEHAKAGDAGQLAHLSECRALAAR